MTNSNLKQNGQKNKDIKEGENLNQFKGGQGTGLYTIKEDNTFKAIQIENGLGANTPVKSTLTQDLKAREKSSSKSTFPPFKAGVPSPVHASKSKLELKADETPRMTFSKEN